VTWLGRPAGGSNPNLLLTRQQRIVHGVLASAVLAGQVGWVVQHTHRDHADWLVTAKHAAYVLIVKTNQPTLHCQLATLPWRDIPAQDHTRDRGHHRVELRRLQVTTVAGLDFPTPPRPCGSPAGSGPCTASAGAP
jgi:hypothetical protein